MIEITWKIEYYKNIQEFVAIPKLDYLKKIENKDLSMLMNLIEMETHKELQVVNHYKDDIQIVYLFTDNVKAQIMKYQASFVDYKISLMLNWLILSLVVLGSIIKYFLS